MSTEPQSRLSEFKVFGSFDGQIKLPVSGTPYQFKLRPHSNPDGSRWFEGFLAAMPETPRATVFDDEELKNRFKKDGARPAHFPERSTEVPLQVKLNPFPKKKDGDPEYIGSVWTSEGLFTVFARDKEGGLLLAGDVVPHLAEKDLRARYDAQVAERRAAREPAPDADAARDGADTRARKGRSRAPTKDAG